MGNSFLVWLKIKSYQMLISRDLGHQRLCVIQKKYCKFCNSMDATVAIISDIFSNISHNPNTHAFCGGRLVGS